MSIFSDQKKFMEAAGQHIISENSRNLYKDLIEEETDEFFSAWLGVIGGDSLTESVKEAIDLIYVVAGFLNSCGIDADQAWAIVHESNMRKVNDTIHFRRDGKVQKTNEWKQTAKAIMYDKLQKIVDNGV